MWGMQEADHYAGAETTFMLIRLGMNPWQDCLRESADLRVLFVCLLAKTSEERSSDNRLHKDLSEGLDKAMVFWLNRIKKVPISGMKVYVKL